MTLGEKQRLFTRLVGRLIEWAYAQGYELTFGDAYRSPEQARMNAQVGKGIVNYSHCERLAIDLNLFNNGVYLLRTEAYEPLGVYWETFRRRAAAGAGGSRARTATISASRMAGASDRRPHRRPAWQSPRPRMARPNSESSSRAGPRGTPAGGRVQAPRCRTRSNAGADQHQRRRGR
jgi:hypothetical protein